MLKVTKEELAELAELFDKTGLDASICVVGNEEAIAPDDSWEVYRL
jgi:sulfur carrier protein ThiS